MKITVLGKTGKELFAGSPLTPDGGINPDIPAPVYEALVKTWTAYAKIHGPDRFESYWRDYARHRIDGSFGFLQMGYDIRVDE